MALTASHHLRALAICETAAIARRITEDDWAPYDRYRASGHREARIRWQFMLDQVPRDRMAALVGQAQQEGLTASQIDSLYRTSLRAAFGPINSIARNGKLHRGARTPEPLAPRKN